MNSERQQGLAAGLAGACAVFFWTMAGNENDDMGVFAVQLLGGCVLALLSRLIATSKVYPR